MLRLLIASAVLALLGCASDTASAPSTTPTLNGTRGVTQGGPQDIAEFRAIVGRGEIPSPTTLDATGFFAEHAFDLPPADCGSAVCLAPMLAVAPRFDGRNWTMGFVALSTSVDPATLPRPPLHLVIAVTTAERSNGAARGLAAMVASLRPDDRVTLIEPGPYPRVTMFGRPAREVSLALSGVGGTSAGAVYESLAEASQAIDTLPGFTGSARVVLITSGPDNSYVRDAGRIVALGEALARRGVALSVIGTGTNYRAEVPAALGALGAVLSLAGREGGLPERVMDAGSARYSPILPWLRLYGLGDAADSLIGINLEFDAPVRRDGVLFRYGDVTATGLPDGHLDAVTCMSVIEHGVPLQPFLAESARILRPGGILVISTDYDHEPPDTAGKTAYGVPVHIFSPREIRALVADADAVGLDLVGELTDEVLRHPERPCHWDRVDLDYTFILLSFRRR